MSEHRQSVLPWGVDEDDLRYVRIDSGEAGRFEAKAKDYGWQSSVLEGFNGNRYKVQYVLSRIVHEGFDDSELERLKQNIGLFDENDEPLTGYEVWTEGLKVFTDGRENEPVIFTSKNRILYFEFEGFPTNRTMDVLETLLPYFEEGEDFYWVEPPKRPPAVRKKYKDYLSEADREKTQSRMSRLRSWLGRIAYGDIEPEPPKLGPQRLWDNF